MTPSNTAAHPVSPGRVLQFTGRIGRTVGTAYVRQVSCRTTFISLSSRTKWQRLPAGVVYRLPAFAAILFYSGASCKQVMWGGTSPLPFPSPPLPLPPPLPSPSPTFPSPSPYLPLPCPALPPPPLPFTALPFPVPRPFPSPPLRSRPP